MIEPTNLCNFKCPACPTGSGLEKKEPKRSMNLEEFKVIVDPVKNFIKRVRLWGFGEPFLAPDFPRMIKYLSKNNILISVHTNGSVLNKKIIDSFKENPKLRISFSIDGLTQKTYGHYRKSGNLKKVLANLEYLVDLKSKYDLNNLELIWQFLVNRENEQEVSKVRKLAKEIGIDKLRIKTINIKKEHPRYIDFISKKRKYRRIRKRIVGSKDCGFIDPGMPVIYCNGSVTPCCAYPLKRYSMGNVFEESLMSIWDSAKYKKFRQDNLKGVNRVCNKNCRFFKTSKVYVEKIDLK